MRKEIASLRSQLAAAEKRLAEGARKIRDACYTAEPRPEKNRQMPYGVSWGERRLLTTEPDGKAIAVFYCDQDAGDFADWLVQLWEQGDE